MCFITSNREKDVNIDDPTNFDCSFTISRTKNDDVARMMNTMWRNNFWRHYLFIHNTTLERILSHYEKVRYGRVEKRKFKTHIINQ